MTHQRINVRKAAAGFFFFVGILAVYLSDPALQMAGDSPVNIATALSLVREGDAFLRPDEAPYLFEWTLKTDRGETPVFIAAIDEKLGALMAEGSLWVHHERYQLTPSARKGEYANTFGVGASASALPMLAPLAAFSGDLRDRGPAVWRAARVSAALCTAGSALFLFLAAAERLSLKSSLLLAAAYGLGTCVWSVSSQGLWQHGPNELFLAAGGYFLCRPQRRLLDAAACGAAFALASWCRPTSALVGLSASVYLLAADRRHFLACVAAASPIAAGLAAYNWVHLGSPLKFGQTELWRHAVEKTGSSVIFQTPLWTGAVGALWSPSRGLFIYSPFLLLGVWGAIACWRDPTAAAFRPLSAAVAAIWTIEFMHFDWWGGWSFGYRHIVDTAVLLCLTMVPVVDRIRTSRALSFFAIAATGWSIAVQALAVVAYDNAGWNARETFVVFDPQGAEKGRFDEKSAADVAAASISGRVERREMDVDQPEYRWRLWSWRDNPICFMASDVASGRRRRAQQLSLFVATESKRLAISYQSLGRAFLEAGDRRKGEALLREAERQEAR